MFRVGIVTAQDLVNCRVRVKFPDRDQMQSWWLSVLVTKSQDDKFYHIPDVGEQVVCAMDEHDEDGAVLGAVYSSVDTPPVSNADKFHVTFKDGAVFEYDRALHALTVALPAGATMNVSANGSSIAIDASGDVTVNAGAKTINLTTSGTANVDAAQVVLAGGGPAVARVGDTTTCPAGTGHITSGSGKVQSG